MAKIYNPLKGTVRQFAVDNKFSRAEWTSWVKGGRRMATNPGIADVAGNGQFGFHSKRQSADPVKIMVGIDGQYLRKRANIARRRKPVSPLWTRGQIAGRESVMYVETPVRPKRSRNRRSARRIKRG